MSNYTKTVDFAAKDTLPSGDSGKIIKGTEFETEFDNISTAIATKADSAAPTFTGTSVFTNLDINGTVQADGAVTVGVDDTGYDVKFFGATAGKSLLWDESADSLIVTGTTTLVGTTNLDAVDVDGNMTFGDNNKAIFGADSDLQIYHDGDTSYISHNTTGTDLVIQATSPGDDVIVRAADDLNFRVNGNENGIVVVGDGATSLYHANSQKIATSASGVSVTGTVTADDSSSADSTILTLANSYTTDAAGDSSEIMFQHYRSYSPSVTDSAFIKATKTQAWDATGDRTSKLEFGTRNGATEPETRMTIMPDGSVGIGTTSPNNRIDAVEAQGTVANVLANGTYVAKFTGNTTYTTGASQGILIGGVDGSLRGVALVAEAQSALNDHDFIIAVSGTSATPTERMRIDASGHAIIPAGVTLGTAAGVYAAANTLDDYEEGTWTPTLYYQNATGVTRTYTEQTGHYTKIGNTVTVWCTLKGGTSNSGSYANDNIGISGLPFSVIGGNATAPVRQSGFAGTASVGTLCMLLTSSVALLSTPEDANNLADDLGAGATYTLTFSGSYETTE